VQAAHQGNDANFAGLTLDDRERMSPAAKDVKHTNAHTVTYYPNGEQCVCEPEETLLDSARRMGIRIANACGGRGACKSCSVQFINGYVPDPTIQDQAFFSEIELANGWRRACQAIPQQNCCVEIPPRSQVLPSRAHVEGADISVRPDPAVRTYRVAVAAPSLDGQGDGDRLLAALNEKWKGVSNRIDIDVMRTLPETLRTCKWSVQAVVRYGEVVGILPGKGRIVGLAVDLGSTNIAVLLVNLRTGRTIDSRGIENPQAIYGGDLITRISYVRSGSEGLQTMRRQAVTAINEAALDLCARHSVETTQLADVVIAGNTVMQHLLLELPVDYLGKVPFAPGVNDVMNVKARDVGIEAMPGAYLHIMANIAGFVGGDHTAVLTALGYESETRTAIALDIGTNTEISLIHRGQIFSVSCPSGPALEGGEISCGMQAANGAIEAIEVGEQHITPKIIGECNPVGVCGSGVIDTVAKLYRAGIVDTRGRISDGHSCVRQRGGSKEVVLSGNFQNIQHEIVFTQHDLRAVQLAKAAIRTGVDLLLEVAGVNECEIEEIVLAGAFGNYVDLESCIAIGMLPSLPIERYSQIGNAAGIGAKLVLSSHEHRTVARGLARKASYIELAGSTGFMDTFLKRINLPEIPEAGIPSNEPLTQGELHECQ
jgi:uncharacterized 2Fe-2S/4Fe-4S cluster protein (DUF4445 family)